MNRQQMMQADARVQMTCFYLLTHTQAPMSMQACVPSCAGPAMHPCVSRFAGGPKWCIDIASNSARRCPLCNVYVLLGVALLSCRFRGFDCLARTHKRVVDQDASPPFVAGSTIESARTKCGVCGVTLYICCQLKMISCVFTVFNTPLSFSC